MANRKPLTLNTGQMEQLQGGDFVDFGAYQTPNTIGTAGQVLASPAAGTALEWVEPGAGIHTIELENANANTVNICMPVYLDANGKIDLADANTVATSEVFGLVQDTSIATGNIGTIAFEGVVTATTGQWDAVAGTTGGLSPGKIYFLSETAGALVETTPPTTLGSCVVRVGRAVSATQLVLMITPPIKL